MHRQIPHATEFMPVQGMGPARASNQACTAVGARLESARERGKARGRGTRAREGARAGKSGRGRGSRRARARAARCAKEGRPGLEHYKVRARASQWPGLEPLKCSGSSFARARARAVKVRARVSQGPGSSCKSFRLELCKGPARAAQGPWLEHMKGLRLG